MVSKFDSPQTAREYLKHVGMQNDNDINVFEAAMALAAVNRPSIVVDKYRMHMDRMVSDLMETFDDLCASENSDSVEIQRQAMEQVFVDKYDYDGDSANYDDLQNVDIMRCIDRRKGMPITLSILVMALCEKSGWSVAGLNFPGHFLVQMDKDGQRLIVDPFQGCKVLAAPDLRLLIKKHMGRDAELSSDYYAPCSNREILLRLQNNIKYRLIESEHYNEALQVVELMLVFAPGDNRLRLDMAVLLSRLGQYGGALEHLQSYIDTLDDGADKDEALLFMKELMYQLN